ncbi:hypothetical protein, partial [uncultured Rikenella sp.]|uniref:hypothetical protein n=1 Tax=Alistipes finegoldii TaxID=214856 RepID=UPI00262F287B
SGKLFKKSGKTPLLSVRRRDCSTAVIQHPLAFQCLLLALCGEIIRLLDELRVWLDFLINLPDI